MKSISVFIVVVLVTATSTLAQSNSYQLLKDKFKDQPDVYSFSFSGWMGRLVLNLVGEFEFKDAIKDIKQMRLITIPRSEFLAQQVSVAGFKKRLKKDSFEELAFIRDEGEEVSIYLREGSNNKNHYFVLVEEEQEVIAIELKGYLDPKLLNPKNTTLAVNK
jgi:Domain of unknown function (DUF4252)